jgi:hypothetical protein
MLSFCIPNKMLVYEWNKQDTTPDKLNPMYLKKNHTYKTLCIYLMPWQLQEH